MRFFHFCASMRTMCSSVVFLGVFLYSGVGAESLLFEDTFNGSLNNWVAEFQKSSSSCKINGGKMDINNGGGGGTIICKQKISGNSRIEYECTMAKGSRISDCNLFWMMTKKGGGMPTGGGGRFQNYWPHPGYYAGIGGNNNSTTRFRRHPRKSISEKPAQSHGYKLKAGHTMKIVITCKDGRTTLSIDGKGIFDYKDKNPYTSGYFAIRSLKNHMIIDNVRFYSLDGSPTPVPNPEPGPIPDPEVDFSADTVMLDFGGTASGWNSGDAFATGGTPFTFSQAVETGGAGGEAPAEVYQTVLHCNPDEIGSGFGFEFPDIADGSYTVRFHVADQYGDRAIDITAEGTAVVEDLDPMTEGGGAMKPVVKEVSVTVSDGNGLQLTLGDNRAEPKDVFLSGVEIIRGAATSIPLRGVELRSPAAAARSHVFGPDGRILNRTGSTRTHAGIGIVPGAREYESSRTVTVQPAR